MKVKNRLVWMTLNQKIYQSNHKKKQLEDVNINQKKTVINFGIEYKTLTSKNIASNWLQRKFDLISLFHTEFQHISGIDLNIFQLLF